MLRAQVRQLSSFAALLSSITGQNCPSVIFYVRKPRFIPVPLRRFSQLIIERVDMLDERSFLCLRVHQNPGQFLSNAGGDWEDAEVVTDGKLITSRKPDDIPAFNQAILAALSRTH